MTRDEIEAGVRELLAQKLDLPAEELREESDLRADLGIDSMSLTEVMMELELRFGFEAAPRAIDQLKRLHELVTYVYQAASKS